MTGVMMIDVPIMWIVRVEWSEEWSEVPTMWFGRRRARPKECRLTHVEPR